MFFCRKFRNLPMDARSELGDKIRLCTTCLRKHGRDETCHVGLCHVCKSPHSILLCEINEETSRWTRQPAFGTIRKKVKEDTGPEVVQEEGLKDMKGPVLEKKQQVKDIHLQLEEQEEKIAQAFMKVDE